MLEPFARITVALLVLTSGVVATELAWAAPAPWVYPEERSRALYFDEADLPGMKLVEPPSRSEDDVDAAGGNYLGKSGWQGSPETPARSVNQIVVTLPTEAAATAFLAAHLRDYSEGLPPMAGPQLGDEAYLFGPRPSGTDETVAAYICVFRVGNVVQKLALVQATPTGKPELDALQVAAIAQRAVRRANAVLGLPAPEPLPGPEGSPPETAPSTSTETPATTTEEPRRRRHRRERSGDGLLADVDWDEFNEMPVLMSAGASRSTNAALAESRWGVAMGLRNTRFGDNTPLSFGYDFRVAWAHYRWADARGLVGLGLPLGRLWLVPEVALGIDVLGGPERDVDLSYETAFNVGAGGRLMLAMKPFLFELKGEYLGRGSITFEPADSPRQVRLGGRVMVVGNDGMGGLAFDYIDFDGRGNMMVMGLEWGI